ncbi:MAG: hypothetical protein QM775_25335 [Pirellulales bacterium]
MAKASIGRPITFDEGAFETFNEFATVFLGRVRASLVERADTGEISMNLVIGEFSEIHSRDFDEAAFRTRIAPWQQPALREKDFVRFPSAG